MALKYAGEVNAEIFNGLKFLSLNCNSLNLSSATELFDLKIKALSNLNFDVLFMSDLRMGEIQNQSATHKISAALLKTKLADFDFFSTHPQINGG